MPGNGLKLLLWEKRAGIGWKGLSMTVNIFKRVNGLKGWKLMDFLEMAGNG